MKKVTKINTQTNNNNNNKINTNGQQSENIKVDSRCFEQFAISCSMYVTRRADQTLCVSRKSCCHFMPSLQLHLGPCGSMSQVVVLPNNSYKPITNTAWVSARLCKLQKGCIRLPAASDQVYQLLAHGRWFSPGTPASSTTKTDSHDIAEILLKVTLKHEKSIKSIKYT